MMQEFQIQLITRDGQVLSFKANESEDIVSAAERAELYLSSQCRVGSCGACIGTAQQGQYVQDIDPEIAKSIAHTEQVLLCRTYPRSDLHTPAAHVPVQRASTSWGFARTRKNM